MRDINGRAVLELGKNAAMQTQQQLGNQWFRTTQTGGSKCHACAPHKSKEMIKATLLVSSLRRAC